MRAVIAVAFAVSFVSCGLLGDIKLGSKEGIPPIKVNTVIDVPADFKCGNPIQNSEYTVTTTLGTESPPSTCTFVLNKVVSVIKADDYANRPELAPLKTAAAAAVSSVDLAVSKFDLTDDVKKTALDRDVYVKDLNARAFGETVFTKADVLKAPPYTKSITGQPLVSLQTALKSAQPLNMPIDVTLVMPLSPVPPAHIGVVFEAQPSIAISLGGK